MAKLFLRERFFFPPLWPLRFLLLDFWPGGFGPVELAPAGTDVGGGGGGGAEDLDAPVRGL